MTAAIRILWDADDAAVVNISGGSWTVGGNPVSFPYTMTTSTTFTGAAGVYDVSVKLFEVEIASTPDGVRTVSLNDNQQEIFAPSIDGVPGGADGNNFLSRLDEIMAGVANTPSSDFATGLSASYAPKGVTGTAPRLVDVYNDFFVAPTLNIWVTGQGNTGSALTATAAAGATSVAVADGAGFPTGTAAIANPGTADQQIVRITGGGGSAGATTLTLSAPLTAGIASGTVLVQLWRDSKHLTDNGLTALSYWLARRSAFDDLPPGGKVTMLGNSWFADGGTKWGTQFATAHAGSATVNAGIIGNTSADMITRFAADVPPDSDFVVINEPGVNDISAGTSYAVLASRLASLISLIRGIGAVPVVLAPPPMFDNPARSARLGVSLKALTEPSGAQYPLVTGQTLEERLVQTMATDTWGMGPTVLQNTSGASNTALGSKAAQQVTTGTQNTAVGALALNGDITASNNTAVGFQALAQCTTGGNTAVGSLALKSATTAAANTAVGYNAMLLTTTGGNDTAVGNGALTLNTTGNSNTAVGSAALGSSTTANNNTGLGYNALNGATTGGNNVGVGFGAGVTSTPANATKTGIDNVFIGTSSGPSGASGAGRVADPSSSVGIGRSARTGGNYAVAIGAQVIAGWNGSVAIGTDDAGGTASPAAVNEYVHGTANHKHRIPGLPTSNPGVGTGYLWNDGGTVRVA